MPIKLTWTSSFLSYSSFISFTCLIVLGKISSNMLKKRVEEGIRELSKDEIKWLRKNLKYLMSWAIRKFQIKTSLRFYLNTVRMADLKMITNEYEERGSLFTDCRCAKSLSLLGEELCGASKKIDIGLLYDTTTLLLGMYSTNSKS